MRTLVTGSSGFLGNLILTELKARGREAHGLDLVAPQDGDPSIQIGSILDPEAVRTAMRDVDCVIHAAAIPHLWARGRFTFDRVNGVGTCRVLAEARRVKARFVYVSSYTTLIARDTTPGTILDESAEIEPGRLCGAYPKTKRQAELFVQSAAANGVDACTVMPSAPIGAPDPNLTPPSRMIADLAAGRLPALLDCTLNLVDARAVARATVDAAEKGRAGERYLLSGEDLRLRALAEMIADRTGVAAPRHNVPYGIAKTAAHAESVISWLTGRAPSAPLTGVRLAGIDCRFSSEKARDALNFDPRPLSDCLDETLATLGVIHA